MSTGLDAAGLAIGRAAAAVGQPWSRRSTTVGAAMRILFVENHEVFAATVIAEFLAGADVTVVSSVAAASSVIWSFRGS